MKSIAVAILAVLGAASLHAFEQTWPNLEMCNTTEWPNSVVRNFETKGGISFDAHFSITSKGNGCLDLPGLRIRVFKAHRDLTEYKDGLLKCVWFGTNEGMYLKVTGEVLNFDEKGNGPMGAPTSVSGYFRYDSQRNIFQQITCSKEIYTAAVRLDQ